MTVEITGGRLGAIKVQREPRRAGPCGYAEPNAIRHCGIRQCTIIILEHSRDSREVVI